MKIIPLESNFEISTSIQKADLLSVLRKKVNTKTSVVPLISLDSNYSFVGDVYDDGFDIKEVAMLNYSLNAVYHGRFKETDHGMTIRVKASNIFATFAVLFGWIWWIGISFKLINEIIVGDFSNTAALTIGSCGIAISNMIGAEYYYYRINKVKKKLESYLLK